MKSQSRSRIRSLAAIKIIHTVVWMFFVLCIVWIPVAGVRGQFANAAILIGIVLVECAIILVNRGRCPLTDLAEQITNERAENFDIYLPIWLARWNKEIFGTLFALGVVLVFGRWFLSMK